jgi:TPR repeat protein
MDRYRLGELLGSGADGKVYFAVRHADKQPVCIKQIPQDKGFAQKESGSNEVAAYQRVSHRNIPVFFEHFLANKMLNLVIEFAEGDPLRHIIYYHKTQKIPIPEPFILNIFAQMVSLLKYFKGLGIIYCDVKPENMIVDRQGCLKIVDFGTAKPANTKLKKAYSFGGTLAYMSPEMLADGGYSFETDVWSLGILIFEMMTHILPFGCRPEKEVVRKIQNVEMPEIKSDYSQGLKNVVKLMLRKKPAARISIEKLEELDFLPKVPSDLTARQLALWGTKHKLGLGIPKSDTEALRFFKMSADAGSTTGMFHYCFAILNTDRRQEGLAFLKQAADLGNRDALYNYALSLEQGWGGSPDLPGAMRYYKLSADAGNAESMCTFAIGCTDGWAGAPDIPQAVEYYRQAADRGHPFGMFNYANALASGLAGPANQIEAMKWYKLAADAGEVEAMFNYGACLSHGWSGKTDLAGAAKYFKMAADQGNDSAAFNYAIALEYGHTGAIDLAGAVRYYKMAADAGHQEAREAHARLTESRLPSLHKRPTRETK